MIKYETELSLAEITIGASIWKAEIEEVYQKIHEIQQQHGTDLKMVKIFATWVKKESKINCSVGQAFEIIDFVVSVREKLREERKKKLDEMLGSLTGIQGSRATGGNGTRTKNGRGKTASKGSTRKGSSGSGTRKR